jgi:hypothetical protein
MGPDLGYGINVRNHIVGLYAGRFERDVASPMLPLRPCAAASTAGAADVVAALDRLYSSAYAIRSTPKPWPNTR